jgi:hypothetical protein
MSSAGAPRSGWHSGHTDSGNPCSCAPVALGLEHRGSAWGCTSCRWPRARRAPCRSPRRSAPEWRAPAARAAEPTLRLVAAGRSRARGSANATRSRSAHVRPFPGRTILRSGLHFRHCDSGTPCSSHQSPVALKAGISAGLQRVHCDSGTPCSPHQSSCEPGTRSSAAASPSPGQHRSPSSSVLVGMGARALHGSAHAKADELAIASARTNATSARRKRSRRNARRRAAFTARLYRTPQGAASPRWAADLTPPPGRGHDPSWPPNAALPALIA